MMWKRTWVCLCLVVALAGAGFADKPERNRSKGHEESGWATNAFQSLEYEVLIEVAGYAGKVGGENQSGIVLATAAVDLEAAINEWLYGHVGLLQEDGTREDDHLDEAYIMLGDTETLPLYLVAGRFYQPFGNCESAFVTYPLTYTLSELNQESAMVGYGTRLMHLNVGAFRGDVDTAYEIDAGGATNGLADATISDFYASAEFTPVEQVKFGAYWLSDLMETYNLRYVGNEIATLPGYEKKGAAGAFANGYFGRFTITAEYVSSIEGYKINGGHYVPSALNLEGSFQMNEKVAVGIKYEASDDLYATYDRTILQFGDKLPGQTYGAVIKYAFHEHAEVAAEYLHVMDLDDDATGDIATVQLGLVF